MSDAQRHKEKIVFVLRRLYPGGAERVLITLMNNLDREKYDIHLVTLTGDGTIRHWLESDITVHDLHKKAAPATIIALYKKLRHIRPDIVVATMVEANATVLCLRPLFPKTRFIVRESSLPTAMVESYDMKGRICKYIYKYLYPKADLVICPSKIIIEEFRDKIGIDISNQAVLYNPVNERRIHSTIGHFEDSIEDKQETLRFVCVGRLGYEKGYDRLIEHLQNFKPEHAKDWQLNIIGKGTETKALGTLIRDKGLQNHVHLVGYFNTPWQYMAEADCLLLPSRWEGMPNVVLEALACGTHVIASQEAGGVKEIAQIDGGDNVEIAKDMNDFVAKMQSMKPEIPALPLTSKLPREFSLKNVMRKFEELLF